MKMLTEVLETDVFVISEWGPVGYVLKSSLALKNLSRLSDDHFFEQKNWFKKSQNHRTVIFRYSDDSKASPGTDLCTCSFFAFFHTV
jgi:hypothetical protein